MPIVTLRDLFTAELHDVADAERQTLVMLPAMAESATSTELRDALREHLEQTRVHAERVELILRKLGAATDGPGSEAMRGLLAEGWRRIEEAERGEVLDAALIGIAQRIEHYEMAAYGCARTYARTLENGEAEQLLQQTLDEEAAADERLSRIAERRVNPAAADEQTPDPGARSRLVYVPASAIPDFKYREFRVRSADDDLGSLDGFIVEGASHQPVYGVVDSGGWFIGQRFLVPLDRLRPDEEGRSLRTDLDREAIRAHPPFVPDAYERETTRDADAAPRDRYQPPTWLMTGVWMTEASGFASVPPRAQSDFRSDAAGGPPVDDAPDAESELMIARGEDERSMESRSDPDHEPRIERYRER